MAETKITTDHDLIRKWAEAATSMEKRAPAVTTAAAEPAVTAAQPPRRHRW